MKPHGSRGREAIALALARLAAYRPDRPSRRPAYDYTPRWPDPGARQPPGVVNEVPPRSGSLAAAAADLRAGRVTSLQLVEESLLAIEKHDAELHALVWSMAASARAEAAARDLDATLGRWLGPLHGIPITVKDVIDVAGVPTQAGSAAYHDVPARDADAVARLRATGAVILAKVATHEFALGVTTPQCRNPYDVERIPGGSSGGSAIAVSTGMGLGSLGTDTRASIRVPAAMSGVVGLKPTYGSIPTGGVVPLSWTMDHVALMAPTVQDAGMFLDALRPDRPAVAGWAGTAVAGLRVGVPGATFREVDPDVGVRIDEALVVLTQLGCRVDAAARPTSDDLDAANAAGLLVSRCEAAAFHRALGADRSRYWDEVADQLAAASDVTAIDYIDAQRLRAELAEGLGAVFADHDVLAMPTVPMVAPPVADFARHLLLLSRNATPWSFTGMPAMSVPCGRTEGLPVGIQLVAPPGREDLLIALGSALEAAAPESWRE